MIYECTDCNNCASFSDGFRIICLSKKYEAEEVFEYQPLGDRNAENCGDFSEGSPQEFDIDIDWPAAEDFSYIKYKEVTYKSIREWCEWKLRGFV